MDTDATAVVGGETAYGLVAFIAHFLISRRRCTSISHGRFGLHCRHHHSHYLLHHRRLHKLKWWML